jgi:hypothetical protein
MVCKGDLASVELVDIQKMWPLAQKEATKEGRRLCSTEEI